MSWIRSIAPEQATGDAAAAFAKLGEGKPRKKVSTIWQTMALDPRGMLGTFALRADLMDDPAPLSLAQAEAIVLTLGGDIDVATSGDVLAAGLGVLGSRHCSTLCLDLAGVTFLDSTGIGALVSLRNAAGDYGRTLVLRDPSPATTRLLQLTGLSDVFDLARPIASA